MKKIAFVLVPLCFVALPALAGQHCSPQTTRGSWAYTCDGYLAGQILPQTLHGQANNNENCTGTITYTQTIFGQPAPDLNIRYVILDYGDTIKGLPVDQGQVLSCVLNRMSNSDGH